MRRARGPRYPDRFNGTTKYTAWAVFEAGHAAGKDLDRRRGPLIQTRFGGSDYAARWTDRPPRTTPKTGFADFSGGSQLVQIVAPCGVAIGRPVA